MTMTMTKTAHRVTHTTRHGSFETLRVFGAPDCDMAAMLVVERFGSTVKTVEAIDADAPRVHNEQTLWH